MSFINFFSSPNIIKVIKKDEMCGHVARMGDDNAYRILVRKLQGRDHFEDLGIDARKM
jgi:hypothetical protein